jgi:TPR repeat protein
MGLFASNQVSLLDQGLDAFAKRRWRNARRRLEEAAHEEHRPTAEYHLGLLYWRGLGGPRDPQSAVYCFRRAAESGHAAAQTALGLALQAGVGTPKDEAEARDWFRSAAGAGDVAAMTQLARHSSAHDALSLLERAAETGYADAMRNLSEMMLHIDVIEALTWLYVSAVWNSDEIASERATKLAKEMTASEIAAAQKRGRAFLKKLRSETLEYERR